MEDLAGKQLGPYRILAQIGQALNPVSHVG